jgi:hypothetical protein
MCGPDRLGQPLYPQPKDISLLQAENVRLRENAELRRQLRAYRSSADCHSPAPPRMGDYDNLIRAIVSSFSSVAWSSNRLDVFALGTDNACYHKWWDGSQWGGWEKLGNNTFFTAISAVSWSANRLDLFGVATDKNACLHKWWDGRSWGGWESLGGILISELRNY